MSMPQRKDLHDLIDTLPDRELSAAHRYLEFLGKRDPMGELLAKAPVDDEPETAAEAESVAAAKLETDRGLTSDEVRRQLGL